MTTDFRETLYTINKKGERKWVFPALVKGKFFWARTFVTAILMAIYLSLPWIEINGHQAIHIDILNRKFLIFGTVFWATDTKFLVVLLGILAICLFFFTSLTGRLWCGWACPETVFLEFLFRPIERLIEGNNNAQKKLSESPWNLNKIIRKGTKYLIFSLFAWVLASTFLAYFVGREPLIVMMQHSPAQNPYTFAATIFMMGLMLFQFGWFREQFCTVVCPYARFQSVLMDANSIVIGYDSKRGEPRGKAKDQNRGDCVDCGLCVRVCPTGIDIRNGLQLECINCAACIDACDSIMTQVGQKLGLIRYDTENKLNDKPSKILRPRVIIYAIILIILVVIMGELLENRSLSEYQLVRSKTSFEKISDNQISNQFSLHISNKSQEDRKYCIFIKDNPQISLTVPLNPFPVSHDSISPVPLFIKFDPNILIHGHLDVELFITDRFEEGDKDHEENETSPTSSICSYNHENIEHAVKQRISLLGPSN
jgi:cytochrome c oxidase accessory protein FixG